MAYTLAGLCQHERVDTIFVLGKRKHGRYREKDEFLCRTDTCAKVEIKMALCPNDLTKGFNQEMPRQHNELMIDSSRTRLSIPCLAFDPVPFCQRMLAYLTISHDSMVS